jgi:hypothetical protein
MMVTVVAATPLKVTVSGAIKFVPLRVRVEFAHPTAGTALNVGKV